MTCAFFFFFFLLLLLYVIKYSNLKILLEIKIESIEINYKKKMCKHLLTFLLNVMFLTVGIFSCILFAKWNKSINKFGSDCSLEYGKIENKNANTEDDTSQCRQTIAFQAGIVYNTSVWQESEFIFWVTLDIFIEETTEKPGRLCKNIKKVEPSPEDVSIYLAHFILNEPYSIYPFFLNEESSCEVNLDQNSFSGYKAAATVFLIIFGCFSFILTFISLYAYFACTDPLNEQDKALLSSIKFTVLGCILLSVGFFDALWLGVLDPLCNTENCGLFLTNQKPISFYESVLNNFSCTTTTTTTTTATPTAIIDCFLLWQLPEDKTYFIPNGTCVEKITYSSINYSQDNIEKELKSKINSSSTKILLNPSNPTICKEILNDWTSNFYAIRNRCFLSFGFVLLFFMCSVGIYYVKQFIVCKENSQSSMSEHPRVYLEVNYRRFQ